MVARTRKFIIFYTFYFIWKLPSCINGEDEVSCAFFFGDSQIDNGNNNFLITLGKGNYPPYGIDYPAGPTGRFCNGKNVPDFLAEFLGFEQPVPPFATAKGDEILKGVNYGSGGAGILDQTGLMGSRITMNEQLLNHGNTVLNIALLLGNTTLATHHLNKCLYVVNIGSNDYINNYFLPQYFRPTTLYSPQRFAEILIDQYHQQLRSLYNYGARKVVIFGLGILGLIPKFRSNNGVDDINKTVHEFNDRLPPLINALNTHLDGSHFILINSTNIALTDHSTIGVRVVDVPCCVVSKITGTCEFGKTPCSNRNEYYFWDNYHPTETANRAVATRAYHAPVPADAYPIGIRDLVRQ